MQPIVIDRDGVIVIGHCRALAAKKLKLKTVPCVMVDDLTPEQVATLRIVDNKSNESEWDFGFLADELAGIDLTGFNFDFGLESDDVELTDDTQEEKELSDRDAEFMEHMAAGDAAGEEDEEYQAFLDKFKLKKTTDDCYTPENVYAAVLEWCRSEYGLGDAPIVRPFYPGGDYQRETYPDGCVVIDNPPFSILSDICRFYEANNIKYFLFAPTLTLFSTNAGNSNYIVSGITVTYENGAGVDTSFITNMGDYKVYLSPELTATLRKANIENLKRIHKQLPKYEYPDNVITSAKLQSIAKKGIELKIKASEAAFVRALDAQREQKRALYGGGFLISNSATERRKAAELEKMNKQVADAEDGVTVWPLSDRERRIIEELSMSE